MWKKLTCVMIVLFILIYPVTIHAKEDHYTNVLIVVVPSFSFEEARQLVETDKNQSLWQQAAIGGMNVRPDGSFSYLNNMVTLSSGKRAVGVQGWNSFEAGEKVNDFEVRDWIKQISGELPETDLYHPAIHRLAIKNEQMGDIGQFGGLLKQAGVERVVYGHSDTVENPVRYGSLLTMDEKGRGTGELNKAVRKNESASYGLEMDVEYLINKLSTNVERDRMTVIEWGDFHRLYEQKVFMEEEQFKKKRAEQLLRLSNFLEEVVMEKKLEVWLLAPMMHKQAYDQKQQLAPVFYWGEGKGGFLTSSTTKQPYLVSSIDFVPTILQTFGINTADEWTGRAMVREDRGNVDKEHFFEKMDEIVFIYKSRASVLSTYISCLVLALIGAAAFCFFGMTKQETWRFVIRLLLLSALWSPFWFLALSNIINLVGVSGFVLTLIGASTLCGYVVQKLSRQPIFWIGAMTFVLITLDVSLASPLMQRSYLGYDPIIGARYYGIGNEFAGVYLISALMVLHPFLMKKQKVVTNISVMIIFLCLVFFLGKNTLGTNAGATLSAGIAFSFLFYRVNRLNWSWGKISFLFGLLAVAGVALLYMLQLNGEQTHIGSAFQRLYRGDFLYIFELIQRKLAMNLKIFRHSNWTQLLVTSYILGAVILWRKHLLLGVQNKLFLQTGVVSSFALLLLNDSGVVAAATSMFCVVSAHYYWLSVSKTDHRVIKK
ncbi:hypothetical protein [Halalkalibacter nanhaiisediminis]|uniref:Uncharacterized protein n=1 Tax=Halalkalibacter nanhaiisediminis TaxID=688079 RepID=A0A562QB15_9BACI|nr:hypothetical protein [Halalkalibacter nanhaiisediminis]TWI53951.1 hypothetical protein IQ10_03261 [Halalkalibacter nanhaiisediminis]